MGRSLTVGKELMALGVAIFHEQLSRRFGKIDERHIEFLGELFHLPAEIHRMVVGREFIS